MGAWQSAEAAFFVFTLPFGDLLWRAMHKPHVVHQVRWAFWWLLGRAQLAVTDSLTIAASA